MNETWKQIKGYEGFYEVSDAGNVASLGRKFSPRRYLLRPSKVKKGYLMVCLSRNNVRKRIMVHRLVANAFKPCLSDKLQVNHIDGNKENNQVDNLEWVTGSENMIHGYRLGLHCKKGMKHPLARLTDSDIKEIRARFKPREYTRKMLASEYGVSEASIKNIVSHKSWKHL